MGPPVFVGTVVYFVDASLIRNVRLFVESADFY